MNLISRSGWLLTALAALSVVVLGPRWHPPSAPRDFGAALTDLAVTVQLAASVWVLVSFALILLSHRHTWAQHVVAFVVPRALRGLLIAGVGTAFSLSATYADGGRLDGLTLPDRPFSAAMPDHAPSRVAPLEPASVAPTVHTVRPGDTLWAIAAEALPDEATTSQVAQSCAHWYRANRRTIGANPDLILPGMNLHSPDSSPYEESP